MMSKSILQLAIEQVGPEAIEQALDEESRKLLLYHWPVLARPEQIPPGDDKWVFWLIMAGRGAGKTRSGAEWVRDQVENQGKMLGAAIGRTAADVRDVMVEGESGLLNICPPWNRPVYEPSKRRLTWPNGARVTCYTADKPEQLRGPQHEFGWCDELAAWKYLQEAWDNFLFGLRLGSNPRAVVTTTPRPLKMIKAMVKDPTVVVTTGTTYDNRHNLAPSFFQRIITRYEGTRLGEQEIKGLLIEDNPDALWNRQVLDKYRVKEVPPVDEFLRVVVGVDPAVTSGEESDDTGIVTAARTYDGHYYILDDRTCHLSPLGWAKQVLNNYKYWNADRIIGEANNGGDLIETVVRSVDSEVSYKKVHASRGKLTRAEPISALYEQGRVHHVGCFAELEDEMCTWVADGQMKSPNRIDALVWAMTALSQEKLANVREL